MKIIYTGGNFTPAMKEFTEEKLEKLEVFPESKGEYRITLTVLPNKIFNVEISLDNKARASSVGEDYYALVIDTIQKLTVQIKKYRKYIDHKTLSSKYEIETLDEIDELIAREKALIVDELSLDEAVAEMDVLGHNFFIFRDIDCANEIAVLYKRKDGTLGLIRCK